MNNKGSTKYTDILKKIADTDVRSFNSTCRLTGPFANVNDTPRTAQNIIVRLSVENLLEEIILRLNLLLAISLMIITM